MCGIGGIVSFNNSEIDQKLSDDIKNSLNHRGPDHSLTKKIHQNCMPAFLHRVSRAHAVLVLYVSSEESLVSLKRTPGAEWLVQHLHKQRSELNDVLQKIVFVPRPELDLEQVRLRSYALGKIPLEKSTKKTKIVSSFLTTDSSKKSISSQEQFAKIIRQLRSKPTDSQSKN
mgnify:CR=1 FL=1